ARGRAIAIGLPILIVCQWVAISLCLALLIRNGAAIAAHPTGDAKEFPLVRLVMSSLSWVGPLAIWASLLGRSELAAQVHPRTSGRTSGSAPMRPKTRG